MAIQLDACEHATGVYGVQIPDGWWVNPGFQDAELGSISECRLFGPEPFDVTTGDLEKLPSGAAIWLEFIDDGCVGYINAILGSRETTVDGFHAAVIELGFGKQETGPPFTHQWVVTMVIGDCGPEDRHILAFTRRDMAGDYAENVEVLDGMMETLEITFP